MRSLITRAVFSFIQVTGVIAVASGHSIYDVRTQLARYGSSTKHHHMLEFLAKIYDTWEVPQNLAERLSNEESLCQPSPSIDDATLGKDDLQLSPQSRSLSSPDCSVNFTSDPHHIANEVFSAGVGFASKQSDLHPQSAHTSNSNEPSFAYGRQPLRYKSICDIAVPPPIPPSNAGIPTDARLFAQLLIDSFSTFGPSHPFRSKLLFWSGKVSQATITYIEQERQLFGFQAFHLRVTGTSFGQFILQPNGDPRPTAEALPFVVRQAMACARFAEGKAHVILGSEADGRYADSIWNSYIRPILQANGVEIIWLDQYGQFRAPVYPSMISTAKKCPVNAQYHFIPRKRRIKKTSSSLGARAFKSTFFEKYHGQKSEFDFPSNLRRQISNECSKCRDRSSLPKISFDSLEKHSQQSRLIDGTSHYRRTPKRTSDTPSQSSISPYLVAPFHPPPPGHPGLPSEEEMAGVAALNLHVSSNSDIRSKLVFLCGEVDFKHVQHFEKQHHVKTFPRVFKDLYRRYLVAPTLKGSLSDQLLVAFVDRLTAAAAALAQRRAFVMIGREEDGKNMKDQWNAYARPILQRNGVLIIWVDQQGRPRQPVYPPGVIPPEEYGPWGRDIVQKKALEAALKSMSITSGDEPLSKMANDPTVSAEKGPRGKSPRERLLQHEEKGHDNKAEGESGSLLRMATKRDRANKRVYKVRSKSGQL